MRHALTVSAALLLFAACGSSDDDAGRVDDPSTADATAEADDAAPDPVDTRVATTEGTESATGPTGEEPADGPEVPGPGDAVGTLTGPDVDVAVVGQCNYDTGDLTSSDIAFADVRGIDPAGAAWPVRFGLSGADTRNTQLNVNGTQVVIRWPTPGLLEQTTDEGAYTLDTTIGRLVVTTADGYELDISCFER